MLHFRAKQIINSFVFILKDFVDIHSQMSHVFAFNLKHLSYSFIRNRIKQTNESDDVLNNNLVDIINLKDELLNFF